MQPYQLAAEETRKQNERPTGLLKNGALAAVSLAAGGNIVSRILPFLSEHIPANIMRAGLGKIDKRIGGFIESAINNGFTIDDVRGYLSEKFSQNEEPKENPLVKRAQNLSSRYPQVAEAIAKLMQQGQTPEAAAGILKTHSIYGKLVRQIEKEEKRDFLDLVVELMSGNQPLSAQGTNQPQEQINQIQQPNQASGPDPQLMQLIQGIRSSLQGLRGG